MSNAPSATDVANILVYVVPGFFALLGYLARFPQRPQQPAHTLIVSVALSVPLVALVNELADLIGVETASTNAGFALLLVGIGLLSGYLAAALRAAGKVRKLMAWLKMPFPPEATLYEQTLLQMPEDAQVTLVLKDGRVIGGYPAIGPTYEEAGAARELYLVAPKGLNEETGEWSSAGAGMVVNLAEVTAVALDSDPLSSGDRVEARSDA